MHTGQKQLRNQVMQTSCIEARHLNDASSKGQRTNDTGKRDSTTKSTRPDSAMSLPALVSTRDSLAHWILTRPISDFSQIGLATSFYNNPRNSSFLGSFRRGALITDDHGGQGFSSFQVQLP